MIDYLRGQRREYACPRHAPSGVQCRITANYEAGNELPRTPRPGFECRSAPCPTCGDRDPAEDVRVTAFPARLWVCTACNGRWVTIPRVLDEEQNIEGIARMLRHELARWSFEVDSIIILQPDAWANLCRSPSVNATPNAGAIPSVLIADLQVFLDSSAMTEQTREHFHAIARVRSNTVRQAERPVQRLGGSPNRGGVVGSTIDLRALWARREGVAPLAGPGSESARRLLEATQPMVYGATAAPADIAAAASTLHLLRAQGQPEPPETPIADLPVEKESVWVQRATGDLVIVVDLIKATDGSDVVSFRRNSADDIAEAAVTMSRRDFLIYHRAFPVNAPENATPAKPMIEVMINEEWECNDGSAMIITQVDFRKEVVFGDDLKTKKHRSIPFGQFAMGRWRKIVRRSVYDRIRQPEINLAPEVKED